MTAAESMHASRVAPVEASRRATFPNGFLSPHHLVAQNAPDSPRSSAHLLGHLRPNPSPITRLFITIPVHSKRTPDIQHIPCPLTGLHRVSRVSPLNWYLFALGLARLSRRRVNSVLREPVVGCVTLALRVHRGVARRYCRDVCCWTAPTPYGSEA